MGNEKHRGSAAPSGTTLPVASARLLAAPLRLLRRGRRRGEFEPAQGVSSRRVLLVHGLEDPMLRRGRREAHPGNATSSHGKRPSIPSRHVKALRAACP